MHTPIYPSHDSPLRSDDPARAFRVPEGYFDRLSDRLADEIAAKGLQRATTSEQTITDAPSRRPLLETLKPYLYLAAMFVGFAIIIRLIPMVQPLGADAPDQVVVHTSAPPTAPSVQLTDEEYQMFISELTADEYVATSVADL